MVLYYYFLDQTIQKIFNLIQKPEALVNACDWTRTNADQTKTVEGMSRPELQFESISRLGHPGEKIFIVL